MHEVLPGPAGSPPPDPSELEHGARTFGIETEYWDVWGNRHQAAPQVEAAILTSLGVDASTRASLHHALEQNASAAWRCPLPSTVVLHVGQKPFEVFTSFPESVADSSATIDIRLETGEALQLRMDLTEVPAQEEAILGEIRYVRKRLRLPDDLPPGYHELALRLGPEYSARARLIVCPERAFQPSWLDAGQGAGIAISLYGLRSARNWGCGDITDLKHFTRWAAERAGASFVALNPVHAIPNRQPYNISPYLPTSVFYRNPIYLDVEAVADFRPDSQAAGLLATRSVQAEIDALRTAEFVEYERVYRLKLRFLKHLFRAFMPEWLQRTERAKALADYIDREGDLLHGFAVYSALDESIHRRCPDVWTWRSWPEEYQDPESSMTRSFAKKHWRSVLFHKYIQWQLDLQFAEAQELALSLGQRIGLYHDLALATDRFGSDLWAHRDFFASGCRVGAPPDGFSPKGQDWGFPPPNSRRHFEDGYHLFAQSIRKNCRHGGALRMDHVMRFFRLYWIPDGVEATDGTYVRDRYQDLLGILALESVRNRVLLIGEDLGTVPDEVRAALHSFGVLSYRLLYFEQEHGRLRRPAEYVRDALVSATTHDLPTLAGFWRSRDIDVRRQAGLLPDDATYHRMLGERALEKQRLLDTLFELQLLPDWFPRNAGEVPELTGELHNAIVGFLASTPSKLMLLNEEDLLKQTEQQNLPGSTFEYPNWRRKMKCTVEELWSSEEVQAFTAMFRSWLERTGRLAPAAT